MRSMQGYRWMNLLDNRMSSLIFSLRLNNVSANRTTTDHGALDQE